MDDELVLDRVAVGADEGSGDGEVAEGEPVGSVGDEGVVLVVVLEAGLDGAEPGGEAAVALAEPLDEEVDLPGEREGGYSADDYAEDEPSEEDPDSAEALVGGHLERDVDGFADGEGEATGGEFSGFGVDVEGLDDVVVLSADEEPVGAGVDVHSSGGFDAGGGDFDELELAVSLDGIAGDGVVSAVGDVDEFVFEDADFGGGVALEVGSGGEGGEGVELLETSLLFVELEGGYGAVELVVDEENVSGGVKGGVSGAGSGGGFEPGWVG